MSGTATRPLYGPPDLPEGWLDILLRVEDPAFREHSGIDLSSSGAGMTTIADRQVLERLRVVLARRGGDALVGRVNRIERLLRGECEAAGLMDVYYEQCS